MNIDLVIHPGLPTRLPWSAYKAAHIQHAICKYAI